MQWNLEDSHIAELLQEPHSNDPGICMNGQS